MPALQFSTTRLEATSYELLRYRKIGRNRHTIRKQPLYLLGLREPLNVMGMPVASKGECTPIGFLLLELVKYSRPGPTPFPKRISVSENV
jgi:hypothetical protein